MELNSQYEHPEQFSLCLKVRENIHEYIEGYLDALTMESIRAHLSVCYLCQKEYNEIMETIKLVETLPYSEPSKDFAPLIMAAIESRSGDFFQAPVVEMETEALKRLSAPRTTTGQQRLGILRVSDVANSGVVLDGLNIGERRRNGLTHVSPPGVGGYVTQRERIMAALALLVAIFGLALHPWGRAAIGANAGAATWFGDAASSLSAIPGIGGIFQFISGVVQGAGTTLSQLWQTIGRVPMPVVFFDLAVFAAAGWFLVNRRALSHARS